MKRKHCKVKEIKNVKQVNPEKVPKSLTFFTEKISKIFSVLIYFQIFRSAWWNFQRALNLFVVRTLRKSRAYDFLDFPDFPFPEFPRLAQKFFVFIFIYIIFYFYYI